MITVERFSKESWDIYAADAHKIAFSQVISPQNSRIDFALLCSKDGIALSYVTCRETHFNSVYWQFGGAFPGTKGTIMSWEAYRSMILWCQGKYKTITTLIENNNLVMIKMAMKIGFRIHGIRICEGVVLLEHALELNS